jgi:predicted permease
MLVRSTQRLEHADLGLARDRIVVARIDAQRAGYEGARQIALIETLLQRLARVPGARAVTYSENGIFSGTESGTSIRVEAFRARADSDTLVAYDDVGPAYFGAVGAHLLRGRDFTASDSRDASKVAIVNQSMARFFFPHDDPIGRHVTMDSATFEIVGVVADIRGQGVREPAGRRLYVPLVQMAQMPGQLYLEVRTDGDPKHLVEPIRRALVAADASLAVLNVDALDDLVRDSVSQDRLVARVVTLFGALALVLASLGLYGVIAYATLRRTGEFGLRMALGADRRTVTRLVLRDALGLVAGGALVGVPAAIAATRLLRDQLFEIGTLDLPSIGLAAGVLLVSAAVAAYVPALRASRVAPLEALRAE